jgi:Zinc knuckle
MCRRHNRHAAEEVVDDVTEVSRASRDIQAQPREDEEEAKKAENKPNVDCYNCGKHEHYARDCWAEKKVEGKTNYAKVIENEKVLLMAQTPSTSGCDTVWYLDTGASNHMTGHKHLFTKMIELAGTVSFGDASKVEVKEKGNVKFLQKNGKLRMVEDVYYIPEIKMNILSVGQLIENGFKIFMKKRTLYLKNSRVFKLNLQRIEQK